jgi:hypothetical protein
MRLNFRKLFALLVAILLFASLSWFFGIFLQPQGGDGAGFAITLILVSAAVSIYVFAWLARPGPLVNLRNRGVDGVDRDDGMGLMGASQHQSGRRRRDDTDGDDLGGRRSSNNLDGDGDGDMSDGGIT